MLEKYFFTLDCGTNFFITIVNSFGPKINTATIITNISSSDPI